LSHPEDPDAYNGRANLYKELVEYDKALEGYARCIEIDPEDPDAYYNRARLYKESSKKTSRLKVQSPYGGEAGREIR